ncbi:WD40-repeat-containing domain protein [Gymnopilus junonius]|uniref:WD40-repeat-containing domain protein n=1 Tax=Gymnopilus junonius TaxID=109634 RepID=A0A9P5NTR6_GYMJU|nr:WD40-repeat-containing domain protein [Gymnopilus junonius]
MQNLRGHSKAISSLATGGKTAAIGSQDCNVRVWDITTGDCKWVLIGHAYIVLSVNMDERRAYTASGETIRIWNLQTGECTHIFKFAISSQAAHVNVSSSYLQSFHMDGTLRIWNSISGKFNHQLRRTAVRTFQHDDQKIIQESRGVYTVFRGRICVAKYERSGSQ